MAEKIIPGAKSQINDNNGSIIIILTPVEYEIFKKTCLDLLDYYEIGRKRAKIINNILIKLEEAKR